MCVCVCVRVNNSPGYMERNRLIGKCVCGRATRTYVDMNPAPLRGIYLGIFANGPSSPHKRTQVRARSHEGVIDHIHVWPRMGTHGGARQNARQTAVLRPAQCHRRAPNNDVLCQTTVCVRTRAGSRADGTQYSTAATSPVAIAKAFLMHHHVRCACVRASMRSMAMSVLTCSLARGAATSLS